MGNLYEGSFRRVNFKSTIAQVAAVIIFSLFFLLPTKSYATHAAGSDLTYKWISGNTFQVTVTFYRDCAGIAAPNNVDLNVASFNCHQNFDVTLNKISGTGQEITFPCNASTTLCNGGSGPGIQQYVYQGNVSLPAQCTDWTFSYTICCRNCAITTIQHPSPCNNNNTSPNLYVEATLDNFHFPTASSPFFSNIPEAYLCANQPFIYNQGVIDANGDSLSYKFIAAKTDNNSSVTYVTPFTAQNWISSSPAVSINPVTGDITMNPTNINEVAVAAILVTAYRHGVKVGSVIRDMQFRVSNCNPNLLPTATGINGTNNFAATICPGSTLSFFVNSNDGNPADIVTMSWNSGITGATFTTAGSPHPTGTFTWTPGAADARTQPYQFTVTVRDNACPNNGFQIYSFTITVPLHSFTVVSTNINCNGDLTGAITATASGGNAPYAYKWSTNATTQTITGLAAGTYTISATDADGCVGDSAIVLTQPTLIVLTPSSTASNCFNSANGTATISATGGVTPYTYKWSSGQTTASASGLTGGTSYTVSVTDANGCVKTNTIVISQPTQISATVTSTSNETCNGQATGTIDLTVSGGVPGYTYKWSNSSTTQDLSGLAVGTYVVTVTDTHGCTITQSQTITQPGAIVPLITSTTINNVNVACFGDSTGTASVSVTGGTPSYHYEWSNGSIANNISGLKAGTVTVTVTDQNGCVGTGSSTLTQPTSGILITLDSVKLYNGFNVSCNGQTDGGIFITVTGGTPGYTYAWSNTATTDDITGLAAGTYTVTVFDFNGCMDTASYTLTAPLAFSVNVTSPTFGGGTNLSCNGQNDGSATANPAGGAAPYTYSWSTGPTTQTITGLSAGTYTVSVVDANGCSGTGSVTLTEPPTIVINISGLVVNGGANLACFGDSSATAIAVVSGGTSPFAYAWSNGATIDTAKNLAAGIVTVSVSDDNGCSAVSSFTVVQPPKISIVSTVTNALCAGATDFFRGGRISLTTTGGTPGPGFPDYLYIWSNGDANQNLLGVAAGIYTVTVTDFNGCTAVATDTITQPDSIKAAQFLSVFSGGFNVSCNGFNNGSDSIAATGGTSPYQYSINFGSPGPSPVFTGLPAGPIVIQVQDNNGCFQNFDTTLTAPPAVQIVLTPVNVSCAGPASGSISAAVTGGATPYIFNWSNSDTLQNISELQAGTYILTVTDANGCTDTASATLTAPLPIIPSAIVKNITCHGANDGAITLSVTGGVAPYGFQWNLNDDTSQNLTGLSADTFRVVITDVNGCVAIDSFIITEPDSIALTVTTPKDTVGCGTGGTANVNVSGGTPGYTFMWSNGATDQNLTALGVTGSSTTYSVTVTDANGCSKTDSITFFQATPLTFDIFPQDVQGCFGDSTGSAQAFVEPGNGTAPFSYRWSAPITDTTDIVTGLIAGNYSVTVTDANGCTAEQPFMINQPGKLTIDARSLASDVSCNGAQNGFINAITSLGGTPPLTFIWAPTGDTTQDIFNLGPGTYFVTVTDAFGCSDTSSATIHEPPALLDTIKGLDTLGCNTNTTDVNVAVGGGIPPYGYEWSTGDFTASVTGLTGTLTGTTYYVSVTDFNGCLKVDSITIFKLAPVTVNITPTPITGCSGDSTGTVTAVVSGGQSPFKYIWDTPLQDTTAAVTGLKAGTYSVTVTDFNGCTGVQSAQVTEPAKLIVNAPGGAHDVLCNGANNGVINVIVTGGTAPYSFKWATPVTDTTQSITGLAPGHYSLTVTDAHGCMDTSSATIHEPLVLADTIHGIDSLGCNTNTTDVNVTVSGGVAPYAYNWSNGTTTASNIGLTGSLNGTIYSVTITDANGCTRTDSVIIVKVAPVTVVLTPTPVTGCNGDSTGTITSVVSGGQSPFKYAWSTGNAADTTADLSNLKAGTYTVTVTDFNGCTATQSAQVTEPAKLIVNAQGGAHDVLCNGANNGVINVIVTGGTAPYSFKWAAPVTDTTQSITGLAPGHYVLTVTDAHGCFDTSSANINQPPVLVDTLNGTDTLGCSGLLGNIAASVSGGVSPYTYNWSTGETTVSISGLAGSALGITYSVTITDANGCSKIDSMVIVQFGAITVSLTPTPVGGCNGDSSGAVHADVTGGVSPFKYAWSTSSTTDTTADITGLKAGSYTVTVTDFNGCTGVQTTVVTEPAKLIVNAPAGATNVTCNGANNGMINVQVNGGTAPYSYAWAAPLNDSTSQSITGLAPGTYSVTVTDGHGCIDTSSATITQPAVLVDTISGTDTLTCNTPNGGACVAVGGGTAPYSYNWSDGTTNACISGVPGSPTGIVYKVAITDANGCTVVDSITIVQATNIIASVTATDVLGCHGDTTGTLSASVTGGQAPFHYQWDTKNSDTTQNVANVGAGTYSVTVTDKNGCSGIGSATINEPAQLSADAQGGEHDVSCNGAKNGSINVGVSGGTAPYTYAWGGSLSDSTTAGVTGLQPGIYDVTVSDAHGCSTTASATVNEPPVLTDTLSGTDTLGCSSSANGSICAKVGGGVAPYTYSWSTSATASCIGGLSGSPTGIEYSVTVTDANGCFRVDSFKIVQSTAVIASATGTNVNTCNGDSTGSVTAVVTGGTSPYTYQWSGGLPPIQAVTHVQAGNYQVTITDVNGCSGIGSVTVDQPTPLTVTVDTLQPLTCNNATGGSLGAVVSGGVGPYTYIWSVPQTTQNITGLSTGAYLVTVTDANGCTKLGAGVLGAAAPLSITTTVVSPTCNNSNPGLIHIQVNGASTYGFNWSPNPAVDTTADLSNLKSGTYSVTITDKIGGCVKDTSFTLITTPGLKPSGQFTSLVTCHGASNGAFCAAVTGGTAPYHFTWVTPQSVAGQTTPCISGLSGGNVLLVNIIDSLGCSNTASLGTVEDGPTPQFSASGSACGSSGSVTGTASAGYTGTWAKVSGNFTLTPSGNTASLTNITGSGPNEVSWIVTNGTCSFGDTITVVITSLVANAGADFTTCGDSAHLRAVPTQGTTGAWTSIGGNYKFSPDNATSDAIASTLVDGANTFVWTITNGSCTAADTMVVTKTDITANAGQDFSTCDSTDVMLHAALPKGAEGTWSNLDGTKYTFSNASVDSSTVSTLVYGKNVFIWTVTNGSCTATDTVVVTRKTIDECDTLQLAMPTGISPNGDGFNDFFVIHGIQSYPTNELKIYNRWGNLVFSISNYTNDPGTMWYGQNKSGKLLPDGTYFDILTATSAKTGQTITLKQYVDLRRSHGNQ